MKSRLVLLACCLALLSSCGQGDKGTGKAPEFAVIEAKTTTANLTNSYPATIKGRNPPDGEWVHHKIARG